MWKLRFPPRLACLSICPCPKIIIRRVTHFGLKVHSWCLVSFLATCFEAQAPIPSPTLSSDMMQKKMEFSLRSDSASPSWPCFRHRRIGMSHPEVMSMLCILQDTFGVRNPWTLPGSGPFCQFSQSGVVSEDQGFHQRGASGPPVVHPWGSFLAKELWAGCTMSLFSLLDLTQVPAPKPVMTEAGHPEGPLLWPAGEGGSSPAVQAHVMQKSSMVWVPAPSLPTSGTLDKSPNHSFLACKMGIIYRPYWIIIRIKGVSVQ